MTTLPEILAQVKDALEFYRSGANFSGSPHENYERQFDNYGHGGAYVEDGTVARKAVQAITALYDENMELREALKDCICALQDYIPQIEVNAGELYYGHSVVKEARAVLAKYGNNPQK